MRLREEVLSNRSLYKFSQLGPSENFNFSLIYILPAIGRHPVAGVTTCYISTDYEYSLLKFM